MKIRTDGHPATRTALVGMFAASALFLGACSDDTSGSEAGADVEDIQEDSVVEEPLEEEPLEEEPLEEEPVAAPLAADELFADVESFEGETVTVSADVNEVISEMAFTIAGTEGTDVEALLILHDGTTDVAESSALEVTGVVHQAFDLPTVEEEMGVDLEDDLFADFDQQPYIEATAIDTTVPVDEE